MKREPVTEKMFEMNKKQIENLIISELENMLNSVSDNDIAKVIEMLNAANNIVTIGAGRMGYAIKSFTMRLTHLGYRAYHLGDVGVPRTGENDLIIVASSSGETLSNIVLTEIAKKHKSKILLFTCDKNSTLGQIADFSVLLNKIESKQIMKTAPEHATYMLYDMIAQKIAEEKDIRVVENNHSILE